MNMSVKHTLIALALSLCAGPAFAQIGDPDIDALMKRYVTSFNKGDAALLASDVYDKGDAAAIKGTLDALRADEFGKLDVYGFQTCPVVGDRTKIEMRYARIYTYGGKMDDDEAKVFDLVKTPAGWRISAETATKFAAKFSCS
jgi:hypothetical protein